MTEEQYLKNLSVPDRPIDVILDTDAYNEIDDQFAISYLLRSDDKLHTKAICAAPFFNENSISAGDGMKKSYDEIFKILDLAGRSDLSDSVYLGSDRFLENEKTPVMSDAASVIIDEAKKHSPDEPLYVVAIGAITNVASALLIDPSIKDSIVIVWLGGHAQHMADTAEFNMHGDIAAARIVFGCGAPLVQLPCAGVVDRFFTTEFELEHWLVGKNKLADYLAKNTINAARKYATGKPWSRVIWDVTAVAWLLNDGNRFMQSRLIPAPVPEYDNFYGISDNRHLIRYVYHINRDWLMEDLFSKLRR